ncbi:MAG: GGDEF domain-containing protein [Candidatus Nanopelagicales bacterium]|nr:GGDEF domain-containing protein [Candidatus Nanopelagicales bacterium]
MRWQRTQPRSGEPTLSDLRTRGLSAAVTSAEHKAFRRETAKNEAPWIAAATAGISFVLAIANSTIGPQARFEQNLPVFAAGLLFTLGAVVFARGMVPAVAVPWVGAGLVTFLVAALQLQEYRNFSATGLLYSLFAIAAYGPIALDFVVMSVAAVPMLTGSVLVALSQPSGAASDWIVASFAALVISAVLLWTRLRGVDDLAHALAQQAALATEDALTSMLNRRGLEERTPQLFALGARQGSLVSALFIDIDGLKQVNDSYGHEVGDRVIRETARAIRQVMRADDLAGRWGGDEFVVVGIGGDWDPDTVDAGIRRQLVDSAIPGEVWRGTVAIGKATVDPRRGSFADLVSGADRDMYERKARRS